jgi:hypothetical protein
MSEQSMSYLMQQRETKLIRTNLLASVNPDSIAIAVLPDHPGDARPKFDEDHLHVAQIFLRKDFQHTISFQLSARRPRKEKGKALGRPEGREARPVHDLRLQI